MTELKYDWEKLKAQFFESDILNVKQWWESIGNTYSAHITVHTKGWTEEKKQWKGTLVNKVMEVAEQEFIEKYKPDIGELGKYHKLIIGIVAKKLVSMAKKEKDADDIFVGDIEKLWKMIKTEKNEPTVVTRNTGEMKVVQITDEDKQKVDALLDANV